MTDFDVDLFVIGAGSGGVRTARMAAQYGARVAIAEDRYFGGTCVNVGCIPKKLFVYASQYAEAMEVARGYGWTLGQRDFAWQTLINNKDREIARLNGVYANVLTEAGVHIVEGRAQLADANTVVVNKKSYRARYIVLATGGWPFVPEVPGAEHAITSNEAFHLPELPQRIVVVGGGYIAIEFAGIFAALGCEVRQLYRGPLFLRGFDQEIREFLAQEISQKGVALEFNQDIEAITKTDAGLEMALRDHSKRVADLVLYATGRRPATAGLGLEAVGVATDTHGAIKVDAEYRTSVPSIFALGDVTNRINLTPVALAEGMVLANNLFAGGGRVVDYEFIPTAVFSQPNLATVGYTEEQARECFDDIAVFTSGFTPLRFTISPRREQALMKLIVDKKTDRVIGAHMVGEDAGEIIQGIAIAMRAGATKSVFDTTIGIHPTAAEEFVTMRSATR